MSSMPQVAPSLADGGIQSLCEIEGQTECANHILHIR